MKELIVEMIQTQLRYGSGTARLWQSLREALRARNHPAWQTPWKLSPAELAELLLEEEARRMAGLWDRYGAPSAARKAGEGKGYVASFEGPGGPFAVEAESKRKAYQVARREWLRRLLGG